MALSRGQRMSRKQEAAGAKLHGGRTTPRSGGGVIKGDVRTKDEVIEYKWTGKQQVTIKGEVLEKVFDEAIAELKRPVVGLSVRGQSYVLLPEHFYVELKDLADLGQNGVSSP